jgi:preprotein translocase SecE subunit
MTVAVKKMPEVSTRSLFDRLAVASLAGVVYVLGSIGLVAKGLPALWWTYLGLSRQSFPAWALLIVAMLASIGGLIYVGGRLLGQNPPRGVRAGICVGLVGVFILAMIAKWIGGALENWSFERHWFSQQVGIGIMIAVGVLLLGLFVRFFFHPRFENFLRAFEDQGWFHAVSYKPSQGLRVRRGTMLGFLILIGSGVYAYERSLQSGAENWEISLPYTATETIRERGDVDRAEGLDVNWGTQLRILDPGDWPAFKANQLATDAEVQDVIEKLKSGVKIREGDADRFQPDDFVNREALIVKKEAFHRVQEGANERIASFTPKLPTSAPVLDRYYVQEKNAELQQNYVKITKASEAEFKVDAIVPKSAFETAVNKRKAQINELEKKAEELRDKGDDLEDRQLEEEATKLTQLTPESTPPAPMTGVTQFQTLTLVPSVRFVLPLLLGALALWFSWRLVNLPAFADFLIATEAELNKVSWTPRRRLVQDTIVVLVTTLLITFYLLFADLIWSQLLTRVGVLRAPAKDAEVQTGGEDLPW